MDKILQINYQGRTFSIEEKAYQDFQQYELSLKEYFLNQKGGDEIIADLQFRMAEILDQYAIDSKTLESKDIDLLKKTIGQPEDFLDEEQVESISTKEGMTNPKFPKQKRLYRDKKEKIIAGVCGGIANYFAIDPLAVRLIFILVTIFNVATLFALNLGIIAYIILWIILKPQMLEPNLAKKLFRNPKDKVLAGVCGGIAEFFNTEAWVVRLIFIAPLIIGIAGDHSFGGFDFDFFGKSFFSLSFLIYIILWCITPMAKATTDFMLLKGEPINLGTIQNSTSKSEVLDNNSSGLRSFFRIVAYVLIAFILLVMIPTAIAIIGTALYSYSLVEIILFTATNKLLGVLVIGLLFILPIVACIVWISRRIIGSRSNNKPLRIVFMSLFALGFISAILLVVTMIKEHNTFSSQNERVIINTASDTLFVKSLDSNSVENQNVFLELNQVDKLLRKSGDRNEVKAVRIKYEEAADSNFSIRIDKSSFGSNRQAVVKNIENSLYEYLIDNNTIYLSPFISYMKSQPYHLQNALVTIYYPKGKTVITSKELRNQLAFTFVANNKNFVITDNEWDEEEFLTDEIHSSVISTNEEVKLEVAEKQEEVERIKAELQERNQENIERINEKKAELEQAQKDLKLMQENAKKELKQAKDDLNKAMK